LRLRSDQNTSWFGKVLRKGSEAAQNAWVCREEWGRAGGQYGERVGDANDHGGVGGGVTTKFRKEKQI